MYSVDKTFLVYSRCLFFNVHGRFDVDAQGLNQSHIYVGFQESLADFLENGI